jgi:flagellum-specific peptidoglycan hydrolase FlgJ
VHHDRKPWWQQATALVAVTTGGAITGLTFVPGAAETMTSPSSVPLHLLALEQAAHPGDAGNARAFGADGPGSAAGDQLLRSAIVNVAKYYLQLAKTRSPAQMEALIWDNISLNGADHGPSCAAFASLTLELAAQAVGQSSWVSGGSTYPWPVADWADVRVNPNPASLAVTSIVQDAQQHGRWHALNDGYQPQPGDWVVFDGHTEVVTGYANGTLDTIGADSLPDLTVNAHSFRGPLGDDGVEGFVDNGNLKAAPARSSADHATPKHATTSHATAGGATAGSATSQTAVAAIPGVISPVSSPVPAAAAPAAVPATRPAAAAASKPTAKATASAPATTSTPTPAATATPAPTATPSASSASSAPSAGHYRKYTAPEQTTSPGTRAQQEFINLIAPGAIAAQHRYGVPAAVTIAQAIEESAWGNSGLAANDHNLFGIKGTGPAGSVSLPTSEYLSGQWVTINAAFRVYHNVAESIADHAELLATSGYYQRAMADRTVPDAFANDLTGVYATDPEYGANLIALMRLYNLYRFDSTAATASPAPVAAHPAPSQAPTSHAPAPTHIAQPSHTAQPSHQVTTGHAAIPGMAAPALAPSPRSTATSASTHGSGTSAASATASGAFIPGAVSPGSFGLGAFAPAASAQATPRAPAAAKAPAAHRAPTASVVAPARGAARVPGVGAPAVATYKPQLPSAVTTAFFTTAKAPLMHAEQLYREVAGHAGIRWELLAACDWMQCKSHPRYSPVHGEKIGSLNADGTAYRTKSEALAQCASDLVALAGAVYGIDLMAPRPVSVRALADAFAAFRWGALLKRHRVSALEFPYSVAGLTEQHAKMHWPVIDDQDTPDRPGARFREPFGAVPVVLSLNYPATV